VPRRRIVPASQALGIEDLDEVLWIHTIQVRDPLVMEIRAYVMPKDFATGDDEFVITEKLHTTYNYVLRKIKELGIEHWEFPEFRISGNVMHILSGGTTLTNIKGEVDLYLRMTK
jgi:hypothetical protein